MVSKYAISYLEKASNPHILMNSPPLDIEGEVVRRHDRYSIAKYGMSLVVLGSPANCAARLPSMRCGPRVTIATAAIKNLLAATG